MTGLVADPPLESGRGQDQEQIEGKDQPLPVRLDQIAMSGDVQKELDEIVAEGEADDQ